MNPGLPKDRKIQIVAGLANGMGLRPASRVFNTHRTAIQNLLVRVGHRCDQLLTETMTGLDVERLELDEIWTYNKKKQRQLTPAEYNLRRRHSSIDYLSPIDYERKHQSTPRCTNP